MKKTSVNRRKKLPLLLGALLIISVAAYGTRAYFSDSATQQANIELQLGNVEITKSETDWLANSKGTDIASSEKPNSEQKYISYTNVKPGDSFTRNYKIKNTGSLEVAVGLKYSGKYVAKNVIKSSSDSKGNNFVVKDGPFLISIKGISNSFTLKPGDNKDYTVEITVDDKAGEEYNISARDKAENKDLNAIVSDFLGETLTVNAEQIK